MKAFIVWTALGAVSVLLGVALYSTSLQGSATGYRESVFTPRPAPTVVKTRTRTKIVRKPAKTKIVYVPAPAPANQNGTATTAQTGTSSTQSWTPSSNQRSGESSSDDRAEKEDDDADLRPVNPFCRVSVAENAARTRTIGAGPGAPPEVGAPLPMCRFRSGGNGTSS